jgi:hypothetical protein
MRRSTGRSKMGFKEMFEEKLNGAFYAKFNKTLKETLK